MRKFCILLVFISFQAISAEPTFAEKWRPSVAGVLGESIAEMIFGTPPLASPKTDPTASVVELPKLPVITSDARSGDVYNKKPDKIIIPKAEEDKYHFGFLTELYQVTRQLKPTEEEFGRMMNTLYQGATREGVYHSLVLDAFYSQLESLEKPIRLPAQEFTIYYYKTYFNKTISPENFKVMNMYSLKRLMAEKVIEMIDAFGDNREDMEKWYAVLSADLATKFPQHWDNKL